MSLPSDSASPAPPPSIVTATDGAPLSDSDSDDGVPLWLLVLIAVLAVIALFAVAMVWLLLKRRKPAAHGRAKIFFDATATHASKMATAVDVEVVGAASVTSAVPEDKAHAGMQMAEPRAQSPAAETDDDDSESYL